MKSHNKQIEKKHAYDYELYSCEYHQTKFEHKVWHWKYIPEGELENAGWITSFNKLRLNRIEKMKEGENTIREYGLDGLSLDKNGTYHGIQSKFWKSRRLTAHDLGSFFSVVSSRLVPKNNKSIGYLYHTCGLQIDLRDDILNNPNMKTYKLLYTPESDKKVEIETDETLLTLYPPQIEALEKLSEGWENTGLISMPCALGKTVILLFYHH